MTSVTPEDEAHWRTWIGKSVTVTEKLEVENVRRYAAAISEDLDVERRLPSLAHWAFFLPVVPNSDVSEDGHGRRGGHLPPVTLPRRMFASASMTFAALLHLGHDATWTSTVTDVRHRTGRSGALVLVEMENRIAQGGHDCVMETQTIVYRDDGGPTPTVVPVSQAALPYDEIWQPNTVELFRFSAVTFNGHRIHYDAPYATGVEGYPALVVHGTFTAARLYGYAARQGPPLKAFAFRAIAPLFVQQPIRLTPGEQVGEVRAIRCDGTVAMSAMVER